MSGKNQENAENRVVSASMQEQSQQALNSFVFMSEVAKILEVSEVTGKNCILFGKGGYGKSDFSLNYNRARGIDPYVFTMGSGTDTDRLFGGVDLAEFQKSGKIQYMVENSFMNHEDVIFEEMLDAPDFILEQLKDILSSGYFRNGEQVFEIKTKRIICCTNKTREEFAKNTSLKALMERFPLEVEVKWEAFTSAQYAELFAAKYGEGVVDPILPYVLEQLAIAKVEVSPRIALVAAEVLLKTGVDNLRYIAEFSKNISTLKDSLKRFEGFNKFNKNVDEVKGLVEQYKKLDADGISAGPTLTEALSLLKKINTKTKAIEKLKVDDKTSVRKAEIVTTLKKFHERYAKQATAISALEEIE